MTYRDDATGEQPARRSNIWFLLPILLSIIGGLIAYFILRHDDPRKARNCLYLGCAMFAAGMITNMIIGALIIDSNPMQDMPPF